MCLLLYYTSSSCVVLWFLAFNILITLSKTSQYLMRSGAFKMCFFFFIFFFSLTNGQAPKDYFVPGAQACLFARIWVRDLDPYLPAQNMKSFPIWEFLATRNLELVPSGPPSPVPNAPGYSFQPYIGASWKVLWHRDLPLCHLVTVPWKQRLLWLVKSLWKFSGQMKYSH